MQEDFDRSSNGGSQFDNGEAPIDQDLGQSFFETNEVCGLLSFFLCSFSIR